jgi:Sulfotransferase domain
MPTEMPLLTITSPDTILKCSSLKVYDSDVFICSYPKSGTTWMQHIVLSLLAVDGGAAKSFSHVSELAPFFEVDAHWERDALASWIQDNHRSLKRRVFNTHLRFSMLPSQGTGGKFIYIIRSPFDVCVSFYHHLSNQVEGGFEGSFDEFFDDWLNGKLAFGSWIDHIRSYEAAFAATSSGF